MNNIKTKVSCKENNHNDALSLQPLRLCNLTREKILEYFENTWSLTELLFSGLKGTRAFYQAPYHNLRHPLIFYYGHTAACYVNKFRLSGIIPSGINPYFERIFEVGVDEMSWDDMSKNTMRWPEISEVKEYREKVYKLVTHLILTHPAFYQASYQWNDPGWALMLSVEHERIHLETSSVLIREMPLELVIKPKHWPESPCIDTFPSPAETLLQSPEWITVSAQTIKIGKSFDIPYYGWDNEYGNRTIYVKPFRASKTLVSNKEFLTFVQSRGYHDQRYWTEKSWAWRCSKNINYPTFWLPNGPEEVHHYHLRTCFEVIPMQWSWPVIVNHFEAKAYCAWLSEKENKKFRLLTEAEHHVLRDLENVNDEYFQSLNIGLRYGSEGPVNLFQNSKGFFDVFGNVWEWMEDHFCPLEGFKVHPYYTDFSTPCFDDAHHLIMGGSFISTGNESTPWARYHFRPHFFQHAGFRVVEAD